MKLQYDDATSTASGWVDDRYIGKINYPLDGTIKFEVVANTDVKGMQIDVLFDHLTVTKGTADAPTTAATSPAKPPGNLP
jgi:hypothetical protein